MGNFLKRKNIVLSWKTYFITALGAMAYGLFASLLVGTILNTIGMELKIDFLSKTLWPIAQQATGPAIAVSIAYALKAPDLVLFSSAVVGIAGYKLGGPIGTFVATCIATEFGKMVSKETKIDIVVTPTVTVLVGAIVATFIGPGIQFVMVKLGEVIMLATNAQPFFMGIIIAVAVGMALTLPISSAALCMMLSLSGLAGGAATVGCCAQMVGFAAISYRDNKLDGTIAQGIGTSMLQMPNIVKNPSIWIAPTLAGAILGPLSTVVFKMENTPLGSGMGTSGLVGQIGTWNAMAGKYSSFYVVGSILLLHIFLPIVLSLIIDYFMRKKGLVKDMDMKLSH